MHLFLIILSYMYFCLPRASLGTCLGGIWYRCPSHLKVDQSKGGLWVTSRWTSKSVTSRRTLRPQSLDACWRSWASSHVKVTGENCRCMNHWLSLFRRHFLSWNSELDPSEAVFGCSGRQERKPSQSPSPMCGHWSADSDSGLALNHPGVQRQSPSLFRWTPKIIESVWSLHCRGGPISPSAFLFQTSLLPLSSFTRLSLLYFFFSSSAPYFSSTISS